MDWEYDCPFCGEGFLDLRDVDQHITEKHEVHVDREYGAEGWEYEY